MRNKVYSREAQKGENLSKKDVPNHPEMLLGNCQDEKWNEANPLT